MDEVGKAADERIAAGESVAESLRLDGNAAAGLLSELFVPDFTAASATCAGCGTTRPVGALLMYAHGMGAVLRCASCEAVVLCLTRTPTQVWLDPTGVRRIVVAAAAPTA
jgi:hypothetical protein